MPLIVICKKILFLELKTQGKKNNWLVKRYKQNFLQRAQVLVKQKYSGNAIFSCKQQFSLVSVVQHRQSNSILCCLNGNKSTQNFYFVVCFEGIFLRNRSR